MNQIQTETPIITRLATLADIPAISHLQQKWLATGPSESERQNGYLFGDPFVTADFETIVNQQECVIAEQDACIAGYYLLDNFSQTFTTEEYRRCINQLKAQDILGNERIATRAQGVVDTNFQNRGLSRQLIRYLAFENVDKYDLFFSLASKQNPKVAANRKIGWEIVAETENNYWVMYDLRKPGNCLPSMPTK